MASTQRPSSKWKKRDFTVDRPTGPTMPKSTVLGGTGSHIVAFRKHTLLPLDDCLYALQATIPQLTRSSLHRCLERHGISRLPEVDPGGRSSTPIRSPTTASSSPTCRRTARDPPHASEPIPSTGYAISMESNTGSPSQTSLDQRAGGTDESNHQASHRQAILLLHP